MKIVVFGATGNVGRLVVKEALDRGHEVVGVVRDPDAVQTPDPRATLVRGDATDADSIARVARGADAVVSAISPRPNSRGLTAPTLVDNARAMIDGLRRAGAMRVLTVGGAGSLEVAPGRQLVDEPDFPEMYRAESRDAREALEIWRAKGDVLEWTVLSPAVEIGPGERTGRYDATDDRILADDQGRSFISFEDFAVAIVDELDRPRHVRGRFGVAYGPRQH